MALHNQLGKWGEDVAAAYLREKGYTILHRDWKSGHRDLDIVAMQGSTIVFVEVKTLQNTAFADPVESVDYRKLMNLRRAMNHYMNYFHIACEARFDIVSVTGSLGTANPHIEHFVDVPVY